jgi:hypothetical protein
VLEDYKLAREKQYRKLSESGQSSDHWFVAAALVEEEEVVNETEEDMIGECYRQDQMPVVGVDLGSMLVLVLGRGQRGEQSQEAQTRVWVWV